MRTAPGLGRGGGRLAATLLPSLLHLSLGAACAPANLSRTLGPGNYELRGSVGGPFVQNLGPAIPVPHIHLGARVGVSELVDVDGNLNLLAAAYGLWAMDLATNFQLYRRPKRLAVAASTRLFVLGELRDAPKARLFPEVGLHVGRPLTRWLHLYGGATAAGQLRAPEGKPQAFVTPFVGAEFLLRPRRERQHGIALHWSWTNPWTDGTSIVRYVPSHGALGVQLGYRLRFGGLDR